MKMQKRLVEKVGKQLSRRNLLKAGGVVIGCVALFNALIGSITTNEASAASSPIVLRLGHPNPAVALNSQPSELFGKIVEARSNGRIKFEYFPNGTLGNADETVQQVRSGAIESQGYTPTSYLSTMLPYVAAMDLPFLWNGPVDILSHGKAMAMIETDIQRHGIKIIGWSDTGSRQMACTRRAIKTAEDLQGVKWRVPPSEIYTRTWQAWGAKPVVIPMGEVLTSLQTKMIDGVGFDTDTLLKQGFTDVAKYVTISGEVYTVSPLIVNKKWFDSLPKDIQDIMIQTAQIVGDWGALNFERIKSENIQKMKTLGLTVNFLPEEGVNKLKELAKPVYEYARTKYSKEFIDLLLGK